MIHDERERLVERYAGGRMTPTEKSDLVARATQDERLARLLQAEAAIATAVDRDRTAFVVDASLEPGARVLQALAASSAPLVGAGGFLSGSWIMTTVVGVVGLLGISAGLYFLTPIFDGKSAGTSSATEPAMNAAPAVVESPTSPTIPGSVSASASSALSTPGSHLTSSTALSSGINAVAGGGSLVVAPLGGATQRLEETREGAIAVQGTSRAHKLARLKSSATASEQRTAPSQNNTPAKTTDRKRREIEEKDVTFKLK